MEDVVRQGYLTKSPPPGAMKGWKKRFFVLFTTKMEYFGSSNERVSGRARKGYIPLDDVKLEKGKDDPKKSAYHFKIVRKTRTFELVASQKSERDEWMTAIQEVIDGATAAVTKKPERRDTRAALGPPPTRPSAYKPPEKGSRPLPTTPDDPPRNSQPPPPEPTRPPPVAESPPTSRGGGNETRPRNVQKFTETPQKDFPWKFPPIERSKAEELLRKQNGAPDGLFLIRKSTKQRGAYAVSLLTKGRCVHHLIKPSSKGFVINDKVATGYHDLEDLVEFLRRTHGSPLNWKVPLTAHIDHVTKEMVGGGAMKSQGSVTRKPVGFSQHGHPQVSRERSKSTMSTASQSPRSQGQSQEQPDYESESDDEGEWFMAMEDFVPSTGSDKLALKEGDIINVQIQDQGGWWYAFKGDEEGWTPANYLEPCDPPFEHTIEEARTRTATEAGAKFAAIATNQKLKPTTATSTTSQDSEPEQPKPAPVTEPAADTRNEVAPPVPSLVLHAAKSSTESADEPPPPPRPAKPSNAMPGSEPADVETPPPRPPKQQVESNSDAPPLESRDGGDAPPPVPPHSRNDGEEDTPPPVPPHSRNDDDAPPPIPPHSSEVNDTPPPVPPHTDESKEEDAPPPRPPPFENPDDEDSPPLPPRPLEGEGIDNKEEDSEDDATGDYDEATMPSEEPGDPANDYDSIGVVEPVVLPEDQDKVEDPTDSYEFMEAPSKANKVEEGSPNNQDASETTDEVELNPANAPKVREMRNEDRITLMFMFKDKKITEAELLKHVNDYEAGIVDNAIPFVDL
eukprot:m.98998 g.98998  ORF g.98998 m.98998 type:complete len:793 (+) comp13657_c0_seq3:25-2403(+)